MARRVGSAIAPSASSSPIAPPPSAGKPQLTSARGGAGGCPNGAIASSLCEVLPRWGARTGGAEMEKRSRLAVRGPVDARRGGVVRRAVRRAVVFRRPIAAPAVALGRLAIGATALGSFAAGALAMGAVAIGMVRIGRLSVRRAEIADLRVGELWRGGQRVPPRGGAATTG